MEVEEVEVEEAAKEAPEDRWKEAKERAEAKEREAAREERERRLSKEFLL